MMSFNPDSPSQLATLLFGGIIKEEVVEPVLKEDGTPFLYKSGPRQGQIKTHKKIKEKHIKGLGLVSQKQTESGNPSTDDEVLNSIVNTMNLDANYTTYTDRQIDAYKICKHLIKIRELGKLINTYYTSVEELIYDSNSCVHPHFSHVSTDTGRLSCSKPNVQNQPATTRLVHQHFTSRYKEDGRIVSADYSGLEVRIEAQLSGDEGYIKDINNEVDIHTKNLALKKRVSYEEAVSKVETGEWEYERKMVKPFTFVMQYGGGVGAVARKSGMQGKEVKDLLEARKKAFPRLYLYYDYLADLVKKQGWYRDPWGRRYLFKKYEAPAWRKRQGVTEDYSPTEVKNYRTQGFATATIAPIMIGRFWRERALFNRDKYLMINTVHDSLMLDCRVKYEQNAKKDLLLLQECGNISNEYFSYKFNVNIKVDISEGESWAEC